jgi:hypothetical protein
LGAIGVWSVAILCGSIVAACSGTIETPTEEFPPRQGGSSQAQTDDDDDSPRAPAPAPSNNNPPVASNNDDDDPPVNPPADDDEEDPPADDPPADDPPADDPPAAELSFETDIFPILESTCGPCHTSQTPNLAGPDVETAFDAATSSEDRVFTRIDNGGMPLGCGGGAPGDPGCIAAEDYATLEAWYAAGAPE